MRRGLAAARALTVMSGAAVLVVVVALVAIGVVIASLVDGTTPPIWSLVVVALAGLYVLIIAPWSRRWGSTREEQVAPLVGDELVPERGLTMTRAVTVEAPVAVVWSRVAQIGQDRAGFYSHRWLENLAGCEMPAHEDAHPEWQHREVGDVVPLHPLNGLRVEVFEPERAYVFEGGWGLVLAPLGPERTRLIARSRVRRGIPTLLYAVCIEAPHFVMERRMLLNIKRVSERAWQSSHVAARAS